jgi:hypothetical protein
MRSKDLVQRKQVTPPKPSTSSADQVLHLQRTIGNRAVTNLIESGELHQKRDVPTQGTIQRKVNPRFVRYNRRRRDPLNSSIFAGLWPKDEAINAIKNADKRAIELLDDVIKGLQDIRAKIIAGQVLALWVTIPIEIPEPLWYHFDIDYNNKKAWTGKGLGTVYLLIRRLRAVRSRLKGGWTGYTCLARRGRNACDSESHAYAQTGKPHIYLCMPFWFSDVEERADTLIHETLHILYDFMGHSGDWGNVNSYTEFIAQTHGRYQ